MDNIKNRAAQCEGASPLKHIEIFDTTLRDGAQGEGDQFFRAG